MVTDSADTLNNVNKFVDNLLKQGIPAFHLRGAGQRIWIYVYKQKAIDKSPAILHDMTLKSYTNVDQGQNEVYLSMDDNDKQVDCNTYIFYK